MRYLVRSSVLSLSTLFACGDSTSAGTETGGVGGAPVSAEIVYPDSLCDAERCVANADAPETCDPNASHPALDDCTAFRVDGSFSLSAVKIDQDAKRGKPPRPKQSDDDTCPPNSVTPAGKTQHCCERVAAQAEQPAFMLTGITLHNPRVFSLPSVSTTNKNAIEDDRYNWIVQLSSNLPGDVMITSGLGLQNEDGSFAFPDGPFELGGETWNEDGVWDPHFVQGKLSDDGKLSYVGQYLPQGRFFQLPLWGAGYSYTMMVLSMTGIEMQIALSDDNLCGGYLKGNQSFEQVGVITSYLPLDELRHVKLHFNKGDPGLSLCALTASIDPADCDKPVKDWSK